MTPAVLARAALFLSCSCFLLAADGKWLSRDPASWTTEQAERVLLDSGWAHQTGAVIQGTKLDPELQEIPLPTPANAPAPEPSYKSDSYGVDDGKWDGGVSRNRRGEPPRLPVVVRWDSALPVRHALLKTRAPESLDTEHSVNTPERDYIVTVLGLIPAKKTDAASASNGAAAEAAEFDLKAVRIAIAQSSRLVRKGKKPIIPEDVHLDVATGTLQVYFPRTDAITLDDKEVLFVSRYGRLTVQQKFRTREMVSLGKLEL